MTRSAKGFVPAHLTGAQIVMCDTAFPRHLAVLGEPYLRKVISGVLGTRGRIPPAVRIELNAAKLYAPPVQVLLPPHGLLAEINLTGEQREDAAALAALLPEKHGRPRENLGEAQAIILAQDLGAPLLIDDGDGILAAIGRGVQVVYGVHLLQHAALAGSLTDADAWDVWERVCGGGAFKPAAVSKWDTCADCHSTFLTSIAAERATVAATPPAPPGPADGASPAEVA